MSGNQYAYAGPWADIHGTDAFDAVLTVEDERDALGRGELVIAPRQYRVLVDNYQVSQGEVFEGAFPIEIEAALLGGGVIERIRRDALPTVDEVVDETSALVPTPEPEPPKRQRRTTNPKE